MPFLSILGQRYCLHSQGDATSFGNGRVHYVAPLVSLTTPMRLSQAELAYDHISS